MNNYDDLFNKNTSSESLQNKRTEENIAALEDIFKGPSFEDTINLNSYNDYSSDSNTGNLDFSSVQKNESSVDPLEKTSEINNVDLETLRNYSRMLHEATDEPKEEVQSSSQAYGGKQKVLSTNPVNKYSEINKYSEVNKYSEDVSQIASSFMGCFVLAFVTAGIGVGWILYILMHIWFFIEKVSELISDTF